MIQPPPLPRRAIGTRSPLLQQAGEARPEPAGDCDRGVDPAGLRARAEEGKDEQRHGSGDVAVEGKDAYGGEVGNEVPGLRVVDGVPGVGLRELLGEVGVEKVDVEGEVDEEEEKGHYEQPQEARGVEGLRAED